ncbi:unnamed protein product [Adineta ricciae]|uniref:Poly [ADP-ribose] polymerase n=1 Tax=Adineta ricciae TaxID=249248 RepID=A0A815XZJ1_ADIRI|nr:unnamed protein product [Adineta ricciae]CAF1563491.1 unnamed protein product [Adineta ricciae]
MAVNYLNEIISVFLDRNVACLRDNELSNVIKVKDNTCSPEKICHITNASPSLFQLKHYQNGTFLIYVAPTVDICEDFLHGRCSFTNPSCNRLHLCRYFGHCSKKGCRFPHDFTRGSNRRVVERSHCANIDPRLLVRLIKFYKRMSAVSTNESTAPDEVISSMQRANVQEVSGHTSNTQPRRRPRRRRPQNPITQTDNATSEGLLQRSRSNSVIERSSDGFGTKTHRRSRSRSLVDTDNSMLYTVDTWTDNTSSSKMLTSSNTSNNMSKVTINLRWTWIMIVNHPIFGAEYRNYIKAELGCNSTVQETIIEMFYDQNLKKWTVTDATNCLNKTTSQFMRKFDIRSVVLQQRVAQLNILRTYSSFVAFHCSKEPNYVLAMKKSKTSAIMNDLFPKHSTEHRVSSTVSNDWESVRSVTEERRSSLRLSSTPTTRASNSPRSTVKDDNVTERRTLPITNASQRALFADKSFETCLHKYLSKLYNIKIDFECIMNGNPVVKVVGQWNSIDGVFKELAVLTSLCYTKTFDAVSDRDWVKINGIIDLIQHQCRLHNVICVCQQPLPSAVIIHYVDSKNHELGTDGQHLERICRSLLVSAKCSTATCTNEWAALKTAILRHNGYGKRICLLDEQQTITLYGEADLVKFYRQQFELLNKQKEQKDRVPLAVSRSITLDSCQPKPPAPVQLPVGSSTHEQNIPITPKHIQNISITFDIDEVGFEHLVSQDWNRVVAVVESKCSIEKEIIRTQIRIQLPKAKEEQMDDSTSGRTVSEEVPSTENPTTSSTSSKQSWISKIFGWNASNAQLSPNTQQNTSPASMKSAASENTEISITVGNSKIAVYTGDLIEQTTDIIVVCSSSKYLCDAITAKAGFEVQATYREKSAQDELNFETRGGHLPCKRIVFRSWKPSANDPHILQQSIEQFITSAVTYASRNNFTTIAFPSIGCGQLGYNPKLIAEHMIGEAYKSLKVLTQSRLSISFVLLPEASTVYDAFADQMATIQNKIHIPSTIPFDKQTIRIKLTGPTVHDLSQCQNKIKQLAQSYSFKLHLSDKDDVGDWSQDTIRKYYEYCLQKRVIPTLDIQRATLDLVGPRDAVMEADRYFLQLTNEMLRTTRIKVISRGAVWSVEIQSGKWEHYSYKMNEQIENAHSASRPFIDFKNEKDERCRIDFSKMEEKYQTRIRKICRKRIDSTLPNNWDLSSGNMKRVTLLSSSKEFKDVLAKFDETMKENYRAIVKIERIQNERWYKQYAAHRDEFTQRYTQPDERLLFHGCNKVSADKIINECFNRAFAGVNGVVYGCGVYFHEHAKYSSSYTSTDATDERTMFLARVLIGKTCPGTSSMKVPPQGFDTTTDGRHIFVVYHDAGAYGEHLITYR